VWFLVEQYAPGSGLDDVRRATARLADAAAGLAAAGTDVRFAGATYVGAEESCFCRFESRSIHDVRTACERAAFPYDRILTVDELAT
jgi:hypothetical protein